MNHSVLVRAGYASVAVFAALATVKPAGAAILFNLNYDSNTDGVGFLDPINGAARQNAFQAAANEWGAQFDHTATIDLQVTSSEAPNSSTLASAGSLIFSIPGFGNGELIRRKVLSDGAIDFNGADLDGVVDVNWGRNWGLSNDPNDVGSNEFDFRSVIFHELNHTLGFSSLIEQDGSDLFGNGNNGIAGVWSQFDEFIVDINGNPVIDPVTGLLNQAIWDANSIGGASPGAGLFFNGPNALAANSGAAIGVGLGLYTPNIFNPGSSVSHLDDENPLYADLLMSALVGTGAAARELSGIEKGIFRDLGYRFVSDSSSSPTSVPTPSLLGGLVAFGLKISRQRKKAASQTA